MSFSMYFQGLGKTDMRVRNCNSPNDCREKYIASIRSVNRNEQLVLTSLINMVDEFIKPYDKLHSIPWNFKIIQGNLESRFPHTHHDTIYLNATFFNNVGQRNIETLIHEKIHIYQRMYPCETNMLLYGMGFQFHSVKPSINIDDYRSNPDINSIIYSDNNGPLDSRFNTNAQSLGDVKDSRDHPYEIMAYMLASHLTHTNTQIIDEYVDHWINMYL